MSSRKEGSYEKNRTKHNKAACGSPSECGHGNIVTLEHDGLC